MSTAVIADDGFRYGLGAFETIGVENGHLALLDDHLARLSRAAAFLELPMDEAALRTEAGRQALSQGGARGRHALRLTLTARNTLFELRPNPYGLDELHRGLSCCIGRLRRNPHAPLTFHKTLCCGDSILEKRHAKRQGFDEPLLLSTEGLLCEGAVTNVFLLTDDGLVTPSVKSGLLPGTMRAWVMRRTEVTEREVDPRELLQAREVLLTNALMGIAHVRALDGRVLPCAGLAHALRDAYLREARG
ncbi:aminotransferase class IV [Eggerthellaceae bacterium zg-1084]|uniref:aminotransferase class IV n=1 Tax=Berryella wangjianweii TaxID=2734634 RepID=UPI0015556A88|nr:aminotransferase class IV [Berryella wangjianweii]NPD30424.1 aminotransferase class IV [Berryella wangjianweii]